MAFNLVLILLYALALRFEKKPLNILGFTPPGRRLLQLLLGFALTSVLSVCCNLVFAYQSDASWMSNVEYDWAHFPKMLYATFNSVVFEELIFRSYVLFKLVQFMGEKKAVLLCSAAFGIYHLFTFGVLGNVPAMIWVFLFTGLWGLMFAYSYTRTGTILFPIGLHWGWNLFDQVVFDERGSGMLKLHLREGSATATHSITPLVTIVFAAALIIYLIKKHPMSIDRIEKESVG